MSNISFTDWLGNEVTVGARILYPRGFGSRSVEIAEGIVKEITLTGTKRRYDWDKREYIEGIPVYKLKVTSTGRSSREHRKIAEKDVWITVFENVTVA